MNHFIRELSPTFAPAVDRIRRLLDGWNPFDNNIPEALKITSLPNTIKRNMMEETGKLPPCIRRMHDRNERDNTSRNKKPIPKKKDADIVDKYSHFCGMHGRHWGVAG